MGNLKKIISAGIALAMVVSFCVQAKAEYPTKPITLISPYGAGGDSDLSARVWAEFAKRELGQPVLVVNKTGGGGLTGTLFAAKAKPDGYTLLLAQAGPSIIVPLINNVGDLNVDSFEYVSRFMTTNPGVVVNANAPWNSLREFEEDAKRKANQYSFSSPSAASWISIAFRSWLMANDVQTKVVEYGSSAEAVTSIIGEHSDITFVFPSNYATLVQAGKLKLLALGTTDPAYPGVQTFNEQGYKGNYFGWSGIAIPKGTPKEIKDILIAVTDKITQDPEFIKAINNLGFDVDNTSGEVFLKQVHEQYLEVERVLKEATKK